MLYHRAESQRPGPAGAVRSAHGRDTGLSIVFCGSGRRRPAGQSGCDARQDRRHSLSSSTDNFCFLPRPFWPAGSTPVFLVGIGALSCLRQARSCACNSLTLSGRCGGQIVLFADVVFQVVQLHPAILEEFQQFPVAGADCRRPASCATCRRRRRDSRGNAGTAEAGRAPPCRRLVSRSR